MFTRSAVFAAVVASAVSGSHLRARQLTTCPSYSEVGDCYIRNLDSQHERKITSGFVYEPAGGRYSIRCDASGDLEHSKWHFGGEVSDDWRPPFWMKNNDDDNLDRVWDVDYLTTCGEKSFTIEVSVWGVDEPCAKKTVSFTAACALPKCGDSIVDQGEDCDDGNTASGDGCDSSCKLEPVCGNGAVEAGEQCDEGPANGGPDCRADCTEPKCGDSIVDQGEECDDGNTAPGDGCDSSCKLEPVCGNGVVEAGEQCDEGPANGGPDCRADCTAPKCGDSIVDQGEECDDGNTASGDGCNSSCKLEPICGNGIVEAGEQCDDGNVRSGDGCSATCRKEVTEEQCSKDGCMIFSGPVDYATIGNSMSVSEDRRDCSKRSSSSARLYVPAGAHIEKAFLQWSGSGSPDGKVTLNGNPVWASKTRTHRAAHTWDFFGSVADVTNLVSGSGTYTVKNLDWNNWDPYCSGNAAYGAWSLVVVYSSSSLSAGTRLHVCQDKFRFTYPEGKYSTSIQCIEASNSCQSDAEITLVTFEGDNYKGEHLTIGGKYFGNNLFRGSTAPNLDIKTFDLDSKIINGSTSSLSYTIESFLTHTVFGRAIEGLFDFVKVVKYQSTCH